MAEQLTEEQVQEILARYGMKQSNFTRKIFPNQKTAFAFVNQNWSTFSRVGYSMAQQGNGTWLLVY